MVYYYLGWTAYNIVKICIGTVDSYINSQQVNSGGDFYNIFTPLFTAILEIIFFILVVVFMIGLRKARNLHENVDAAMSHS